MAAGQKYCSCGNETRRIVETWKPAERVPVPAKVSGANLEGFVMLHPSHYAVDGKCWKCNKLESYFNGGNERFI